MENIVYEYYHDKETYLTVQQGVNTFCRPHFHRSIEILYLLTGKMITEIYRFHIKIVDFILFLCFNYYIFII